MRGGTPVDEDGMMVLRGWLAPKVGAVLRCALEPALEQVPAAGDDEEPTVAQRRADALELVAESALAGGLAPGNRGDRFQVTAHVATQALASSRVLVNATLGAIPRKRASSALRPRNRSFRQRTSTPASR